MTIGRFQVRGDREIRAKLKKLAIDVKAVNSRANLVAAHECRTIAIKSIQNQSMGTWVKRVKQGGKGKKGSATYGHVASRPGDPPNTDTGSLVRSIAVEKMPNGGAKVGTSLGYGRDLEFGTKKMEARPWLEPAAEQTDAVAIHEKVTKQAIEKATK